MPFIKGNSKPKNSGRKKGTPNKKTMQFKEALGDFSTVEKMKEIYETTEDNNLKFAICKEFMKYEYPQRKAVEFENDNTGIFNIIVTDEKHKKMLEDL